MPIELADAARKATNELADKLEALTYEMDDLRQERANMSAGHLPDGTPVVDMLEELEQYKEDVRKMKLRFRQIANLCDEKGWEAARRWTIRDMARKGERE